MGDTYPYPVFFECHSLGREQMKKVEIYFRIRRRSGGGDCGPLRRVNDTTYSVDFKHEKDQQAVLQRSEHVVQLVDGPLVFTVQSSLELRASANQDSTAAVQEACNKLCQAINTRNRATVDTARGAAAGAPGHVSTTKRIVLLGKTGSGKSNLANTIFGEKLFKTNHSPNSETSECQAETKSVNGRSITLIDTPGFFDAERSEEQMKPEIVRSITECAPGPHVFLIVLKVEKFTEHEQAVITKISQYFSEDTLKYAVIVFTHGDQLPEGMKIEEFVSQNKNLSDLVEKCSGRCHVVDNKYWNNRQQNEYRSNLFQVEELLNTINKMVMENNGDYYTNEMFREVEKEIQKEEENIKQSSGNMPIEEIRQQAKNRVFLRFLIQLSGTATGVLVGAFFGVAAMVRLVIRALKHPDSRSVINVAVGAVTAVDAAIAAAGGTEIGLTAAGVATASSAVAGGVIGGMMGYDAAEGAETPWEAAEMAANAVINKGKAALKTSGIDMESCFRSTSK